MMYIYDYLRDIMALRKWFLRKIASDLNGVLPQLLSLRSIRRSRIRNACSVLKCWGCQGFVPQAGRRRFVENQSKHDNVLCRSSADAQRANCEAPERAGTDRHRQPCLHPYPIIRDAPGARTCPLRCFAIRVLSSCSWRCKTWIVSR